MNIFGLQYAFLRRMNNCNWAAQENVFLKVGFWLYVCLEVSFKLGFECLREEGEDQFYYYSTLVHLLNSLSRTASC